MPKPKWFCVNKEMLQKYQYELDHHLGSIPLNEFTCDHMHENYNYQIQLLHDHLIHSCMFTAERTIPFTKFNHALHWHSLYLIHGRPQSGYIFEMNKFNRSIYHRTVKQLNSNHERIKKTRISRKQVKRLLVRGFKNEEENT